MKLELRREKILSNLVLNLDMTLVQRECFGIFSWRMRVARILFLTGAKVLGVGVAFVD